jgi:hypothetical protein
MLTHDQIQILTMMANHYDSYEKKLAKSVDGEIISLLDYPNFYLDPILSIDPELDLTNVKNIAELETLHKKVWHLLKSF